MLAPRDYSLAADAVAADLVRQLESDPDAFDALLFPAKLGALEVTAVNADVVGSMESQVRAISYDAPVTVRAKIVPGEFAAYRAVNAGDDINEMSSEDPTVVLLSASDVPLQSILRFYEVVASGKQRTVTLYLLHSEPIGGRAPAVGMKHYFIPFEGQDGVFSV